MGKVVALEVVETLKNEEDFMEALEFLLKKYKQNRENSLLLFPLSVFSCKKLGVLETLVKCLKEDFSLSYTEIAHLINRDSRTIWAVYQSAFAKCKEPLKHGNSRHIIPCNIFIDRELGPLEALCIYAKDTLHLSYTEIALILNRHYNTIWLSYQHGIKKRGRNEE